MMALVAAGTLNSSAANLSTAVNGASSGTSKLQANIRISPILAWQKEVKEETLDSHSIWELRVTCKGDLEFDL